MINSVTQTSNEQTCISVIPNKVIQAKIITIKREPCTAAFARHYSTMPYNNNNNNNNNNNDNKDISIAPYIHRAHSSC